MAQITEQTNSLAMTEQTNPERCEVHDVWMLPFQGCHSCREAFARALHPAGSGKAAA